LSGTYQGSQGRHGAEEADVTRAGPADRTAGEEEPELPPRLAAVLDHLEEVAAAHDGELADALSPITPLPADEEEPPESGSRAGGAAPQIP
jgi:hypothetical protein